VSDCLDILISLAPAYTRAILDGTKTVELRRRRVRAGVGTRVWLYSKVPTARVEGTARIHCIHERDIKRLWSEFSDGVGISKADFDEYFRGCNKGYAIVLTRARAVHLAPDLKTMRQDLAGFHPPQFFKRLQAKEVKILLRRCQPEPLTRHPSPIRSTRKQPAYE
jgi:predicted transcriptional regulator